MAKITMVDGSIIEGTAEELAEIAKAFGEVTEAAVNPYKDEVEEATYSEHSEGDYVRVTNDSCEHRKGDVLEIVKIDEFPLKYGVRNTRIAPKKFEGRTGWIDEGNFEPIEFIEGNPKVGDKVLIVNKRGSINTYDEGDVLTVKFVEDGEFVWLQDEEYVTFRNEFEIIERASEEATEAKEDSREQFAVGDKVSENDSELDEVKAKFPEGAKVRIIVPEGEETEFKRAGVTNDVVGTVAKVRRRIGGKREVIVEVNFPGRASTWNGLPSELGIVTFEVGDLVKTVEETEYEDFPIGTIAKVTSLTDYHSEEYPIMLELLDGSDYDFASEEGIVKVGEEDAKKADKSGEAEKGDLIRFTEDYFGVKAGDIVEVVVGKDRDGDIMYRGKDGDTWYSNPSRYVLVAKAYDRKDL